jgi:hypothetical protein
MAPPFLDGTALRGETRKGKMAGNPKVLVACTTLTSVGSGPYMDHMRLYYRLSKDHPNIDFHQMFSHRNSIDRFRNLAFKVAVQGNLDYLMFIDDDMQLPHDTFTKLYAACEEGYDILAALNYIRGYPFDIMAFKEEEEGEDKKKYLVALKGEDLPDPLDGSVVDCTAIGTAVCLLNMKRLKDVPAPWFITGPHNTEDIYFCLKAKESIPDLRVGVHTGVVTGHVLDPEVISYYTRPALMKYMESFMTPLFAEATKNKGQRGEAYVEENIESRLRQNAAPEQPGN